MQDTNMKITKSSDVIEILAGNDKAISDLVSFLLTRSQTSSGAREQADKNIFERPTAQDFDLLLRKVPAVVNNSKTVSWPMVGDFSGARDYMPIRAFRSDPSRLWGPVDKLRIFLSSGTTSGPEGRSRSGYSAPGLSFYRAGSIAAFLGVLERCVLPFSGSFLNTVSVSLIPTVDEWPDSSLAQMVSWFSAIWETHYADAENLDDVRKKLAAASKKNAPLFVFGTAFHFVNLLDGGAQFKLPRGSLVIETGGTKGRSRSVTRHELYELIARGFDINPSRIVSEYGMCELASQAWDFVDAGHETALENRIFRFPWWVRSGVMSTPSGVQLEGEGALTLVDPLRLDISPTAIQTEDLARLNQDQSFQLLGRVPRAPLKGCSMNVRDLSETAVSLVKTCSKDDGPLLEVMPRELSQRAPKARRWLLDLLSDRVALEALTAELGSLKLAQEAILDLSSGLPFDADGFAKAAAASTNGDEVSLRWLLIPPASHSMALIYPLSIAFTAGLNLRVRLPKIAEIQAEKTFLARAIEIAKEHGFKIETLDASWRLGPNDLLDGESVLIFGDDETCEMMRSFAPSRVSSFGNALSLSIVDSVDFEDKTSIQRLIRDQVSLAQRGCLSSRCVISLGGEPKTILGLLQEELSSLALRGPESIGEKTARAIENVRLSQLGFMVSNETPGLTVAVKNSLPQDLAESLEGGISRLDFAMPVVLVPKITAENDILRILTKNFPVKSISLGDQVFDRLLKSQSYPKLVKELRLVRLGGLGAPRLDGLHLGRPFFATEGSFTIE